MQEWVALLALGAGLIGQAAAHGHVNWIVANGAAYRGYDATTFPYDPNHEKVIGWTVDVPDNGFVDPGGFNSPDVICHKGATPAPGHATVKAGDKIMLQWTQWPDSHKGPVIDYLAKCPGDCETVDKTSLEFFKISSGGLIDMSLNNGKWADDVLISNNDSWTVQIPSNLAPGNYVLRHELFGLHSAYQENGAQLYPQCFNLKVEGSGTLEPEGVKGTELYKADDPGIRFNLYTTPLSYTIPGPKLVDGLPSTVAQAFTRVTATSLATILSGGSDGGTPVTASSIAPVSPPTIVPTTLATHKIPATSLSTGSATAPLQSSQLPSPSPSEGGGGIADIYGQCGGINWSGPTKCSKGLKCQVQNPYYSQCLKVESCAATRPATVPKYGQCGGKDYKDVTKCVTGSVCKELNPYYSQCL